MKPLQFIPANLHTLVCVAFTLVGALPAFADGKFFRRVDVADEPGITAQRAVIAFKDGVETLIVQSDVQRVDASFGWILPLPAEPTSISPCPPGSLNVLGQIVQPRIAESPKGYLLLSGLVALAVIAVCASHLREGRHPMRTSPFRIAVGVAVALVVAFAFLPTLDRHRLNVRTAEVLQSVRAGIYDVTVIRGDTTEEVTNWLSTNGFACPPSAAKVIEDYVSEDWCFLAARIAQDAAGDATHHPLKVTFPAAEAVYPMRLTGSDGEPVQLDLYVIADEQASAAAMRVWHCDTYEPQQMRNPFGEYVGHWPSVYKGREFLVTVGVAAVSSLMWPECTVTRLRGRLGASDMSRDLTVNWSAPRPVRATLFSHTGAIGWGGCIALVALAASFVWFTRGASRNGWTLQAMLRRRLPAAIGIGLALGAAFFLWVDVVPISCAGADARRSFVAASMHQEVLDRLSQAPANVPFPEAYRGRIAIMRRDEIVAETDYPVNPGEYRIDETDDGWLLTIIDSYHVPVTIPISSNGVPLAAGDIHP